MKQIENDSEYSGAINELLGTTSKYDKKLIVQEGELVYVENNVSSKEGKWFEQLGIPKSSEYFTVEFDYGDNKIEKKSIKTGKTVKEPSKPKNLKFLGWYYLKVGGKEDDPTYTETEFNFSTPILSDYMVYAKYSDDGIMMARNNNKAFWQAKYKPNITSIIFTDKSNLVPSSYKECWNVKKSEECADIMAYLEYNENDNTTYKLTVYSPITIYANPDTRYYFNGFTKLSSIKFDNFDTSKSVNFTNMFYGCETLEHIDISMLNSSKVTSLHQMFRACNSLKNIDLSSLDTSNVVYMNNMFMYDKNLQNINLDNINTSKVKTMRAMFCGCHVLDIINLTKFDTRKVEDMSSMFEQCKILNEIDLRSFNTNNVLNMNNMFRTCEKISAIYVSSEWTTENATTESMFYNCKTKQVTLKQ